MTPGLPQSGFAVVGEAHLDFELAGAGEPLVMIHAGVADCRQWNNEFESLAASHRVMSYDLRGYGRSAPAAGEFSHLGDLLALLEQLSLDQPLVLLGCSMGGGVAIEFALAFPERARALILVGSAPPGLQLDVPPPAQAAAAEAAYLEGDLDRVAELETQILFDGAGRDRGRVNPEMRRLVLEMNRTGLAHDARRLGKRLPDSEVPAVERLADLRLPVLFIVGAHDTAYLHAAAEFMVADLPSARQVVIEDAAHLPNLDHPEQFRRIVTDFLSQV